MVVVQNLKQEQNPNQKRLTSCFLAALCTKLQFIALASARGSGNISTRLPLVCNGKHAFASQCKIITCSLIFFFPSGRLRVCFISASLKRTSHPDLLQSKSQASPENQGTSGLQTLRQRSSVKGSPFYYFVSQDHCYRLFPPFLSTVSPIVKTG